MDVTLKNGKQFIITFRAWDVLATWQPETQADIDWLVDDCDNFNAGVDLDWLEHCPTCQGVSLDVQEAQG